MHAPIFIALCLPMAARAAEIAPPPGSTSATTELALTWQAPAGCPPSTEVQAQFVRLLGGPGRAPSAKHIAAAAMVRSTSSTMDRWVLDLATVLDGAAGHRVLVGDSCASVASAAALILALMIDPSAAERDRKSTRLNSSHSELSRMPSSA